MKALVADERLRPELFVWNGPVSSSTMNSWLGMLTLRPPEELRLLWGRTGGGQVFETETFLGPFGDPSLGCDVLGVNAHHRSRGLPAGYLIFHTGLGGMSAVRESDGAIVVLTDTDYRVSAEYDSLEAWYLGHIRNEYVERYGLPLSPPALLRN